MRIPSSLIRILRKGFEMCFIKYVLGVLLIVCIQFQKTDPAYSQNSADVIELRQNRLHYYSDAEMNRIPDFSHAGYMGGGVELPEVAARKTIGPVEGDNTSHIQRAIDEVSSRRPNANGFRGAVVLEPGIYPVESTLFIRTSGVVLRGSGDGTDPSKDTIIQVSQSLKGTVLQIGSEELNWHRRRPDTTTEITSEFLPVGSRVFNVSEPDKYEVGDHIVIRHFSTEDWLRSIDYGGTASSSYWQADYIEIYYYREVVGVSGHTIAVDAPIFSHFDMSLSNPIVFKPFRDHLVEHAGVEHLRIQFRTHGENSESHGENGVMFRGIENGWSDHVTVVHFKMTGFGTDTARNITIRNSKALEPHSTLTGERRYNFNTGFFSNNILFENVVASDGRRDFVSNGTSVASGIVFYNSKSLRTLNSSEGHQKWSQGLLYDSISFENPRHYNVLSLYNRGDLGSSHGWGAVHSVAWNIEAEGSHIYIQKPPRAQNYGIGNRANVNGVGLFEQQTGFIADTDKVPRPESLYRQQLDERLRYGLPPDMPLEVRVSTEVSNQLTIQWVHHAIKNSEIVIERAAGNSDTFKEIGRADSASRRFSDSNVGNQQYRYRLYAEDENGISAYTYPVAGKPTFSDDYLPEFDLLAPEHEAEYVITGSADSRLMFEWEVAGEKSNAEYTLTLFDSGNASRTPLFSKNSITVSNAGITYAQINELFEENELLMDETMEIYWTIQASTDRMSRDAAQLNKIYLKKGVLFGLEDDVPEGFQLDQNYPNPFNPVTTIRYHLAGSSQVDLSVYNIAGSRVAVLDEGLREQGSYAVEFSAHNLASGLYFYRLNVNGHIQSRKMLIVK